MEQNRSSGQVDILGTQIQDLSLQREGNRMGLCAQQNLLWDKLTVDEHLNFIGALKGLSSSEISH